MSRSYRKSPFRGLAADSDKGFKVSEHRRERHARKIALNVTLDGDAAEMHGGDYGNPWDAPKDGKVQYTFKDAAERIAEDPLWHHSNQYPPGYTAKRLFRKIMGK